jgi:hypothetical protein
MPVNSTSTAPSARRDPGWVAVVMVVPVIRPEAQHVVVIVNRLEELKTLPR